MPVVITPLFDIDGKYLEDCTVLGGDDDSVGDVLLMCHKTVAVSVEAFSGKIFLHSGWDYTLESVSQVLSFLCLYTSLGYICSIEEIFCYVGTGKIKISKEPFDLARYYRKNCVVELHF